VSDILRRFGASLSERRTNNELLGSAVMIMRCLIASLVIAISSLLSPAWSTSFSTDQSDLWYIPAESGWGIQFVQRGSVIFATMFVYDQGNIPIWYVATMNSVGNFTWTGDLLLTMGPWFGTMPFNPDAVTFRKVGTMRWVASTITGGTLTYSVDGVPVSKNITRQLLVLDDYSGHYGGGIHQTSTGCFNPAFNGTFEDIGTLNITQNGAAITLQNFPATGGSCSYPGTLTQLGQMGDVAGSYVCSDGESGTFHLFEMQVTTTGLTGRFTSSSSNPPGCQATGWFGGLQVTTF
jgi:hypothetical protein